MKQISTLRVADILQDLEGRAPSKYSEMWDNTGLLVGDPAEKVQKAVVGIDLTSEVVALAAEKKCQLIVNHHPCIFPKNKGIGQILADSPIYLAIRHGISIISSHTNFDRCALEVVERVSKSLGIQVLGRLHDDKKTVDSTLIEQEKGPEGLTKGSGYGFWGEFPSPRAFSDVAKDVKSLFNIHGFWITEPIPSQITRVGFVAGKGSSFVDFAVSQGCDLLITGEAGYHTSLGARRQGTAVMELGHRESECFFLETMENWLSKLGVEVLKEETPTQRIW